ncbi:uncharacterized protein [Miscanthus floridulus]|uniref:uncharacterized protein isoform X4 n=1 Tax=Miscanthus floridulus TaxID=154761 RepID=UPI00345841B4
MDKENLQCVLLQLIARAAENTRYVSVGTSWLNGDFIKVAKDDHAANSRTIEKFQLATSNLKAKIDLELFDPLLIIMVSKATRHPGKSCVCTKTRR